MVQITAKVACTRKDAAWDGATNLAFGPDYQDGRNAEWAAATPNLSVSMTVIDAVAEHFELGGKYTLTFTPTGDAGEAPNAAEDAGGQPLGEPGE